MEHTHRSSLTMLGSVNKTETLNSNSSDLSSSGFISAYFKFYRIRFLKSQSEEGRIWHWLTCPIPESLPLCTQHSYSVHELRLLHSMKSNPSGQYFIDTDQTLLQFWIWIKDKSQIKSQALKCLAKEYNSCIPFTLKLQRPPLINLPFLWYAHILLHFGCFANVFLRDPNRGSEYRTQLGSTVNIYNKVILGNLMTQWLSNQINCFTPDL